MKAIPTFLRFGEYGILLEWPTGIDLQTHKEVLRCASHIRAKFRIEVADVVPAYHSVGIFVRSAVNLTEFVERLRDELEFNSEEEKTTQHLISLPVCYDTEFGQDLQEMADSKELSVEKIIELHTAPIYTVYFIGFLPGFPYLGGLDHRLSMDRKAKPRPLIEKGSVGIGGSQTGIYPRSSPGGWNIIGKTPLNLFDPQAVVPTMINAGDLLKFDAITRDEYELILVELQSRTFEWRKEVVDD